MLPPGHIAGGYLTGKIATHFIPSFDKPELLALTAFFGFIPDLDFFYSFAKTKKMIMVDEENHHLYITHAPIFYIILSAIFYFLFPGYSPYALAFLLGTLSHLLIDTFASAGTAWLYPFSKKLYKLKIDESISIKSEKFWQHWTQFVKEYCKLKSFRLELVLIAIALFFLIFKP